ncbi:hypothetical protein [Acinetobacter guerrae]|uniref:hypothetical protein n=1 Tax=Acinetobacter guerrae TaxID=1843371 RepID=UPI00125FF0BF|nr:hypothetical protein [Acinetobacter guerrae]
MIVKFDQYLGTLHDARLYGFLLDWNPELWKFDVILYVHLFSDFEAEKYSLEKALVIFENASIDKFNITNDTTFGQFYIVEYDVKDLGNGKYQFTFEFNEPIPELVITAKNMIIKTSGLVEQKEDQFLPTNWNKLLE